MNIAACCIEKKVLTWAFAITLMLGGIYSFYRIGRLEDPEFTIKNAQIITEYPGATAMEVAEELTDRIEIAIQQMGQLKKVTSKSYPGKSIISVEMKNQYGPNELPQIWDELRRKVNDVQKSLPQGAGPSKVVDDYGDVYGVFYAIYGDGYSYAELKDYAKILRRELLLCDDVAKVELIGTQPEAVYLEISQSKMAQLGIAPAQIFSLLQEQNLPSSSGHIQIGDKYIRIHPSGNIKSIEEIEDLLLVVPSGDDLLQVRLRDIGTIRRGYMDPASMYIRYNGKKAIGLGISTVKGGNVITMGNSIDKRLQELQAETPIGIEVGIISHQASTVTAAIDNFVINLLESVVIVIATLLVTMGLSSGLLIGGVLVLTVMGTIMVMDGMGLMLERISLGAFIIALGMLVDNAIVITDGVLCASQRGEDKAKAACRLVGQTIWPLLGATMVAVLSFAPIGASQDSTGEFCGSLFKVILISLLLSWVLAITLTPVLCVDYLKAKGSDTDEKKDPYDTTFYRGYKSFLTCTIKYRKLTILIMLVLLGAAIYGFTKIETSFFPNSTRPQFMVHCWMPQGTDISATDREMSKLETYIRGLEKVTNVTTLVGHGGLRFLLTYSPEDPDNSYGILFVDVEDYKDIDKLREQVVEYASKEIPDMLVYGQTFVLGPGDPQKIQARFSGKDPKVLRKIGEKALDIMREDPELIEIQTDWRNRVDVLRPVISPSKAHSTGLTRKDITNAIKQNFSGITIGGYRENDEALPIIVRAPESERLTPNRMDSVHIWSNALHRSVPLSQVVDRMENTSEEQKIGRRNRLFCLTVKCNAAHEMASVAHKRLQPKMEKLVKELPPGYTFEWGGEYESSSDASESLAVKLPVVGIIMVLIVIALFNSVKQPLVILLTVPLGIIGVTAGLLSFHQPFGFMALLGFLSLVGMQIKNAIVLIDEINAQQAAGETLLDSIVNASVSRLRPVMMASVTTVFGMLPLVIDAFYAAMAVTIIGGLTFATILTMVVVPVLFAAIYRVKMPEKAQA